MINDLFLISEYGGVMYLQILELTRSKRNIIVWYVDQEVAVPHTDAAVTAYNFCAFEVERRGFDAVGEGAAVA
jgi:hypothetical protein